MRLLLPLFALLALAACETVATDNPPVNKAVVAATDSSAPKPVDTTATDAAATDAAATDPASAGVVITTNNPEISNTQDFGALTKTVSIAADKARLEAQRKEFKVIQPTALPTRVKTVSVVEYALSSKNKVGEKKFSRFNLLGAKLAIKNCARFATPDDAQLAFLRAGGPRRDSKNLDPDGDGFACDWSPETYRKLVRK